MGIKVSKQSITDLGQLFLTPKITAKGDIHSHPTN
jgi:hypothetical protein